MIRILTAFGMRGEPLNLIVDKVVCYNQHPDGQLSVYLDGGLRVDLPNIKVDQFRNLLEEFNKREAQ